MYVGVRFSDFTPQRRVLGFDHNDLINLIACNEFLNHLVAASAYSEYRMDTALNM